MVRSRDDMAFGGACASSVWGSLSAGLMVGMAGAEILRPIVVC